MSEQFPASSLTPRPLPRATPGPAMRFHLRRAMVALALLSGALASLPACSDNPSRPENSEMRVDPPAVSSETSAPAEAPVAVETSAPAQPTGPLPGAGRRYQVTVGTAYFFDKPEQSAPNGRYLRRGDTFFGEGETDGFVKTGYVQPNGAAGTAWLKVQELRRLGGRPLRPAAPRQPTELSRPAAEAAPNYTVDEAPRAPEPANTGASSTQRAVVEADRAYFHNSPDLATPRKAFCQRGDKVRLGESRGPAVYVTFTNWEKVTTQGWMRKDALRPL